MTKIDIFDFLNTHKNELRDNFTLTHIGLFGSYAKNTATKESDIDLYAEFEIKKFKNIAGAWNFIEKGLKAKIDLFYPHKNMRQALRRNIEKEVIYE